MNISWSMEETCH